MKIMKKIEKKKQEKKEKKKWSGCTEPHETLLNYLNEAAASNGKKAVDLGNKRKKCKYTKKSPTLTSEEADLVEERLMCSLLGYKKSFAARSTVQFFLLRK